MTASPAATVVLPVRDEPDVDQVLRGIERATAELAQPVEVLVVDDSDTGETRVAVLRAQEQIKSPHLTIEYHHRPDGQRYDLSGARREGLRRATGEVVIFNDGDGQHPPEMVAEFMRHSAANPKADIVVGSRYREGGSNEGLGSPLRRFLSQVSMLLAKGMFPRELRGVTDPMSGCFMVRRDLVDPDRLEPQGGFLFDLLMSHPNLRRDEVPLRFGPRGTGSGHAGKSNGRALFRRLPLLRVRTLPWAVTFGLVGVLSVLMGRRQHGRHRKEHRRFPWRAAMALVSAVALTAVSIRYTGGLITLFGFIVCYSLFNVVSSGLEVHWRLYGRWDAQARERMLFPAPVTVADAKIEFSLIVPALDEPSVIGYTLRRLDEQTHPHVEIIVSLKEGDDATIQAAQAVAVTSDRIIVLVRPYVKSSKPLQLNAALEICRGKYVGVFDAEDDVPADLLRHVEALIHQTDADIVQGGVQLINLDLPAAQNAPFWRRQWAKLRGWYCVHNVMEYFFWFSSRMFYQVDQGFVPLGGNTVFVRRELLKKVGGWPLNLTEDCALGVLTSVDHGACVVAAYEPRLATREETPSRLIGKGSLLRQRVRWDQGFLSVFLEGKWRELPTLRQRLMACYILGMPFIQAFNGLMIPVSLVALFLLVGPVPLVMVMYGPFVLIVMTMVLQLIGLREFAQAYGQKARLRHYTWLVVGNYLFQIVLSLAALIALKRLIRRQNGWLKTSHDGLHRTGPTAAPNNVVALKREGSVA